MAETFYAVMIHWHSPPTDEKVKEIDDVLSYLGDWLRFGGSNWLLWSDITAHGVYQTLATKLSQKDSELVVKFDPHTYAGWAPKWVDAWIVERRDKEKPALLERPLPWDPPPSLPWEPKKN